MSIQQRRTLDRMFSEIEGGFRFGPSNSSPIPELPQIRYFEMPADMRYYAAQEHISALMSTAPGVTALPDGTSVRLPVERRFDDVAAAQTYLDELSDHRWLGFEHLHRSRVQLVADGQVPMALYAAGWIHIPATDYRWALREFVLAHEFTHHLLSPYRLHGPPFGRTMRMVLSDMMGPEIDYLFGSVMTHHGVPL